MRRDLIIGILASVLFHVSVLFGEKIIPHRAPPKIVKEVATVAVDFVMPPPEPDKPDQQEQGQAEQTELAPPSLVDMPTSVPVDAFVQAIEPPPPPNLKHGGSVVIPVFHPVTKGLGQIFNIKDLDQRAEPKIYPKPNYPYDLKKKGITGTVTLEFIVDSEGMVHDAYVVSSTNIGFELPAVEGISKWQFRPGRKGGKAVASRMRLPLAFELDQEQ